MCQEELAGAWGIALPPSRLPQQLWPGDPGQTRSSNSTSSHSQELSWAGPGWGGHRGGFSSLRINPGQGLCSEERDMGGPKGPCRGGSQFTRVSDTRGNDLNGFLRAVLPSAKGLPERSRVQGCTLGASPQG